MKLVKKKLPIKDGRNPYKDYLNAGDENDTTGHHDTCPHDLLNLLKHPYNVNDDPLFLLQRLPAHVDPVATAAHPVIVPQNKLTRLIVGWSIENYKLGKEARTRADIDPKAYWHAHCQCEHDAGGHALRT